MKQSLFLEQSQKMVLSQFMKQGLHLLSLNLLELEEYLENEIDQNPFLIKISNSSSPLCLERAASISRFAHLMNQAKQVFNKKDLLIAENILGNLNEKGFYCEPISSQREKDLLKIIQNFDPVGIGASNVQESLLIQLTAVNKTDSLAHRIIKDYYPEFLHKKWDLILKRLGCTKEEFLSAVFSEISRLNFFPGEGFERSIYPISPPDLIIEKKKAQYEVLVRDPVTFKIHDPYPSSLTKEVLVWKNLQLRSVTSLINHLENRKNLLTKIGKVLIDREIPFFEEEGPIEPISIKELALDLQVHPTTIHRAIYKKYLKCSKGILPLHLFFKKSVKTNSGKELSNQDLLQKVQTMIRKESKQSPLSDEMIVTKLQLQGIKIARRTIAKYRTLLKIPAAFYRKKMI